MEEAVRDIEGVLVNVGVVVARRLGVSDIVEEVEIDVLQVGEAEGV
jgi:hypothetical protein